MDRRGGRTAEVSLPPRPDAAGRARRFVAATLDGWRAAGGEDVVLLASELVTNALLHARTAMTVRLAEDGAGAVRLSVSDHSGELPRQRPVALDSSTGRGLSLMQAIADAWGVERHGGGKTVWCRVLLGRTRYGAFDVDAVEML